MLNGGGYQSDISAWSALEQTPSFLTASLSQSLESPTLTLHKDFGAGHTDVPQEYICPISQLLMSDPGKAFAYLIAIR
jgi:hypothetical protein